MECGAELSSQWSPLISAEMFEGCHAPGRQKLDRTSISIEVFVDDTRD